ncbi:DUF4031 domain-containing protein [Knoellia koreensis]|uniref:DUF4031 domain-containing protein n=1 Tax=Knoellia koreensis TaxID=2730921 RepID=UPI003211D287
MTIWIDPPAWPAHGRLWSHLVSDTSYDELHEFAAAQGIPRRGFEGDHYDVPEERYAALVAAGAREVGGRELVRLLQASGLRVQKRRHEKVIASVPDASWLPPGSRADVIASRQENPPSHTVVVRLALFRGDDVLVLDRSDGGGPDLPSAPVGDATPAQALDLLHRVVTGVDAPPDLRLIGYVRNVVQQPDDDYPWPTPSAAFTVWQREVGPDATVLAGRWLQPADQAAQLGTRHWWPLLEDGPRA